MKISLGSDHGGFTLKEEIIGHLKKLDIEVIDHGCYSLDSVDYPDIAIKVCSDVQEKNVDFGILVCTTGIGMSIAANKCRGIRAALVSNSDASYYTRCHNDANVLCLANKYTSVNEAFEIVDIFLNTRFEGGRHLRRVEKITKMEE